jgi:hypothetical protein
VANAHRFLAVKDWHRFQHYSDRNPPWIKFYTELLSNLDFLQLVEAAQAQLLKLWLLRAQFGRLPNDPKLIAGKIATTGKFHLQALIDAGFIVPTDDPESIEDKKDDDASKPPKQSASKQRPQSASTNGKHSASIEPATDASGSAPASARSRESESESTELETTHSLPRDSVRLCAAANRGLAEHSKHPQASPRIHVGQGSTVQAMEELHAAGVPIDFAEAEVFEAARSHASTKGVAGLKYFIPRVVEKWQLAQSSGPSTPRRKSDVADRARIILALGAQYGLFQYFGAKAQYEQSLADAAADPRAFPGFANVVRAVKLSDGIGNQPEHFAMKELVRRLESTNGVGASA